MKAWADWMSETLQDWFMNGAAFLALLWLTLFCFVACMVTVCVLLWTAKGPWDPARTKAEQNSDSIKLRRVYDALRD